MARALLVFRVGLAAHVALVTLIAAGAYAGVIPNQIAAVPHADLAGHAILIGLVAFFLDGALALRTIARVRVAPAMVIAAAGLEEWAQRFSPRRCSCWSDFAADVVGVLLFSCLATWAFRRATARAV